MSMVRMIFIRFFSVLAVDEERIALLARLGSDAFVKDENGNPIRRVSVNDDGVLSPKSDE
jgi:hypothetical protein